VRRAVVGREAQGEHGMNELPKVRLGNSEIEVTRLISGGNPLCGNSHFSPEMNEDMRSYYTEEGVVEFLKRVERSGINALQARGDFHRILYWRELFRRQGGDLRFITQTASEMVDVFENIRVIAAAGAAAIYHHGSRTDRWWFEDQIDRVKDYLACMRDCGVQVGLGTHIPEVIEYAEENEWDVDFYMACFYNLSGRRRESALVDPSVPSAPEEYRPEDAERMCCVIRQTDKMCLAFKILAASRRCGSQEEVREAFEFAFANIKDRDAVVVGMFPKYEDQITLNVEHTIHACRMVASEAG
jgi:hypothetical protein